MRVGLSSVAIFVSCIVVVYACLLLLLLSTILVVNILAELYLLTKQHHKIYEVCVCVCARVCMRVSVRVHVYIYA